MSNYEPHLRIGQLASLAGVDAPTVRSWESRYGVPAPERTSGGQRRYPAAEVERVRAMRRLIDAGYRASEAARMVSSTWPEQASGGLPDSRDDIASLLTEGDMAAIAVLDRLASAMPIEDVMTEFLCPVMREVGERWAAGTLSVAQEHAASALVGSWLGAQLRSLPTPLRPELVATAAPPGERHELGLLMLSLFLRRQGTRVLHLGSDLPATDLVEMVVSHGADTLCLSLSTSTGEKGLNEVVAEMRRTAPDVGIAAGGPYFRDGRRPENVTILPDDLRQGAERVLALATGDRR